MLEDIPSAISIQRDSGQLYKSYYECVEEDLRKEHPNDLIEQCPACGVSAILHGAHYCEACFTEIEWIECSSCGGEYYQLSEPTPDQDGGCPFCNRTDMDLGENP